jgi:hypothetical protein
MGNKKKVIVTVTRNYYKTVEVEVEIDADIDDISTELTEGEISTHLDNLVEEALGNASLNGSDEEWGYQSECGTGGTL